MTTSTVPVDPMADIVARVLTVPLRELYAVLWRCGVLHIDDHPVASTDS
ncbi:Rv1535 domain-containing protein [Mycobacterium dioxanotrophicus]|nr:Rv1535 domain-containing protein [Mycobacterium dioxanotrophicus]